MEMLPVTTSLPWMALLAYFSSALHFREFLFEIYLIILYVVRQEMFSRDTVSNSNPDQIAYSSAESSLVFH